ncbi:hypothetical protein BGL_1c19170 [Burkholderia plantarii]|uniref:Uncharacterized protein n=1 Tax=Burkholderia plantarii TaxID=41899 RepID=A0A0B6S2H8_BURPL|nr:hypothetical protein BGL_1c19170 [Burkholderia plantarii]
MSSAALPPAPRCTRSPLPAIRQRRRTPWSSADLRDRMIYLAIARSLRRDGHAIADGGSGARRTALNDAEGTIATLDFGHSDINKHRRVQARKSFDYWTA